VTPAAAGHDINDTGGTMDHHLEQPDTGSDVDDVEGHFQGIDSEGRATAPPPARVVLFEDDDVEGHVLDLDIERKR
jgi:hypothetical protein